MRTAAHRRLSRAGVVATGAALLLAGCSGPRSKDGAPAATTPSATTPSATTPGGPASSGSTSVDTSATKLTEQILGAQAATTPLATIKGRITVLSTTVPVTADVLEVRADADSTLLRWTLRSASGQEVTVKSSALSHAPLFDTRAVALRDAVGKQVLSPFTFVQQKGTADTGCVCSTMPNAVGDDAEPMYALYPPLSPGATTVDVVLPGFAVARGVTVTRS